MGKPLGAGCRIRLLYTNDPYTKLQNGVSEGTCLGTWTDDTGIQRIDVKWDSGSNLSLLPSDSWEYWWPYLPVTNKEIKK